MEWLRQTTGGCNLLQKKFSGKSQRQNWFRVGLDISRSHQEVNKYL
jgi:hypothetical protein